MSVVRRASDRAKTRKLHSSPYARPQDSVRTLGHVLMFEF